MKLTPPPTADGAVHEVGVVRGALVQRELLVAGAAVPGRGR